MMMGGENESTVLCYFTYVEASIVLLCKIIFLSLPQPFQDKQFFSTNIVMSKELLTQAKVYFPGTSKEPLEMVCFWHMSSTVFSLFAFKPSVCLNCTFVCQI